MVTRIRQTGRQRRLSESPGLSHVPSPSRKPQCSQRPGSTAKATSLQRLGDPSDHSQQQRPSQHSPPHRVDPTRPPSICTPRPSHRRVMLCIIPSRPSVRPPSVPLFSSRPVPSRLSVRPSLSSRLVPSRLVSSRLFSSRLVPYRHLQVTRLHPAGDGASADRQARGLNRWRPGDDASPPACGALRRQVLLLEGQVGHIPADIRLRTPCIMHPSCPPPSRLSLNGYRVWALRHKAKRDAVEQSQRLRFLSRC